MQNKPPACAAVRTRENMKQFAVRGNGTPDVQQGDTLLRYWCHREALQEFCIVTFNYTLKKFI